MKGILLDLHIWFSDCFSQEILNIIDHFHLLQQEQQDTDTQQSHSNVDITTNV